MRVLPPGPSFHDVLKHGSVERQVRDDPIQEIVLLFELAQPLPPCRGEPREGMMSAYLFQL